MICTVFRPKRTKNGHAEIARLYRGRYRFEGDTKIPWAETVINLPSLTKLTKT